MKNDNKKLNLFSRKTQTFFSLFLIIFCFTSFSIVSLIENSFGYSIKNIVASWSPNVDIGKLKFVDNQNGETSQVVSLFNIDYCLPFENSTLSEGENGSIKVYGNGECLVRACYNSKVVKIDNNETKRNITFDCGFNIKIVYSGLDNVGVKVNQNVKKGENIGVSNSSLITVSFLYKGNPYTKVKVENGKLSLF